MAKVPVWAILAITPGSATTGWLVKYDDKNVGKIYPAGGTFKSYLISQNADIEYYSGRYSSLYSAIMDMQKLHEMKL